MRQSNISIYIIAIVAGLLFLPFLGGVHLFDWDEINFAECAREMISSGDYLRPQIDFMPFWEKPPLFIWFQVLSMKIWGVGAYAARFPNAVVGIISVIAIYRIGRKTIDETFAKWWVVMYLASWLPHFYFKTGIIDPTFNLFIFLAFVQVHQLRFADKKWQKALLAGLFLGLATLTKGPAGILIACISLVVYLLVTRNLKSFRILDLILIALSASIPFLAWMGINALIHGATYALWFLNEFILYQIRLFSTEDSDHGGPFFYHFIVLLVGCFPASVFLFGKSGNNLTEKQKDFRRWMWILFGVVLILFSIVKTKIVHYSSLCYFPLTAIAALYLRHLSLSGIMPKRAIAWALGILGSIIAIVLIAVPIVGINKNAITPLIADKFAVANLRASVNWGYWEIVFGGAYFIGIIVAARLFARNNKQALWALAGTQIFAIQSAILHFTPKIEAYSQRAAIDYFESFSGQPVIVQPLGYKSYANLFYTQKPNINPEQYIAYKVEPSGRKTPEPNVEWLLHGTTDIPVYFICKINDSTRYAEMPELHQTGAANGFVFFRKK